MERKNKLEKAYKYVAKALVSTKKFDKQIEYNVKTEILKHLKTIFASEFKLKESEINYIFTDLQDCCAIFEIRQLDGKDCYYINIGERYFRDSTISGFIATLSHEFGHLRQAEIERRGGETLGGISISEGKVALFDRWQKLGFNFKYNSSPDEYDANRFSMKKLRDFLDVAEKLGEDEKVIRKKRARTHKIDFQCGLYYDINRILLSGWRKVNGMLGIEEETSMFGEDMPDNMSDEEYLHLNAMKNLEEFGEETEEELKAEIQNVQRRAKKREKFIKTTKSNRMADEKLFLTDCYIKLLAIKMGLNQDEIAISLNEHNELFEFVYSREKNQQSPIFGYLSVSVRNMLGLTTTEYDKILKKKMTEILKEYKINSCKKDNAIEQ